MEAYSVLTHMHRSWTDQMPGLVTANGQVRYDHKSLYRNGTTRVISQQLDLIMKLAALALKPRVIFRRFQGVFKPNRELRFQLSQAIG